MKLPKHIQDKEWERGFIGKTSWKRECNEFIRSNAYGKILDVGCGKFPHLGATTIDFDDKYEPDIVANVNEKIPLPDNTFDTVILNCTLEHLYDPKQAISECRRVLKSGGQLLLTVPFLIKIHQEPIDYLRYTEYMLRILFPNGEITPSKISFTEQITAQLKNLSGLKRHPISMLVLFLAKFLPTIHHKSYIEGYLVKEIWNK